MKPPKFEYRAARTVEEAVSLLQEAGEDAKILAGGQSLVPMLNFRLTRPSHLIDINKVSELDYIREEDGRLAIGALTRERTIERSALVRQKFPLLTEATQWIGHVQIRNRGTIGGSVAHADPASEYPALVVLSDAELTIQGPDGSRTTTWDEFFVTYLTTSLQPFEVLTELRFPLPKPGSGYAFVELARRHGDFALVGCAAQVTMNSKGMCQEARLALIGVGPFPHRSPDAEAMLRGQKLTDKLISEAGQKISEEVEPEGDMHASTEYRRAMSKVFTERALKKALSRVQGGK